MNDTDVYRISTASWVVLVVGTLGSQSRWSTIEIQMAVVGQAAQDFAIVLGILLIVRRVMVKR